MAALQDWLNNNPVKPDSVKTVICEVWRALKAKEDLPAGDRPQLMGRGLERC